MAYIPSADPSSSELSVKRKKKKKKKTIELRDAHRAETVRYTFSNILLFKTVTGAIKQGIQRVARR